MENKRVLGLILVSQLSAVVIGLFISTQWLVIGFVWTMASIYIFNKKWNKLNEKYKALFVFTLIAYPFIEAAFKISFYFIQNSYQVTNRLEHFVTTFFVGLFLFFLLEFDSKRKLEGAFESFTYIAIVNFVGLVNEIVEFIIRYIIIPRLTGLYEDTMKDLVMNLGGSILVYLVLRVLRRYQFVS
jgi:hypothetical protein